MTARLLAEDGELAQIAIHCGIESELAAKIHESYKNKKAEGLIE